MLISSYKLLRIELPENAGSNGLLSDHPAIMIVEINGAEEHWPATVKADGNYKITSDEETTGR